jgi:hypothetical protein
MRNDWNVDEKFDASNEYLLHVLRVSIDQKAILLGLERPRPRKRTKREVSTSPRAGVLNLRLWVMSISILAFCHRNE